MQTLPEQTEHNINIKELQQAVTLKTMQGAAFGKGGEA